MRRIESMRDYERGTVTFDLEDGRYITFTQRQMRDVGLARLLEAYGITPPTQRLPVIQDGRRIGTMAPDFDPACIRSRSFMYDPRPRDFRREGDTWIVDRTLGASDVDCVVGFVREAP
jgi:hypothetical protein